MYHLAGNGWKFSAKEELPENWKNRVSAYLKAWVCNLNPSALAEMAELVAMAGYKDEARQALQVVLLFPSYAETYFGTSPEASQLVRDIVKDAHAALRDL